jgi:hypothetical protein
MKSMPEKRYKKGCGPGCIGCWVNNLKHGNKQSKEYLKKHPELEWTAVHHVRPQQRNKFAESNIRTRVHEQERLQADRVKHAKAGRQDLVREHRKEEKELQTELEDVEEYSIYF